MMAIVVVIIMLVLFVWGAGARRHSLTHSLSLLCFCLLTGPPSDAMHQHVCDMI